jgi:phosphomannomutase
VQATDTSQVISFGTDGWRGIIADDFTFDNVRLCAQSIATYLRELGSAQRGVVIGYDTRFASEDFARVVAEAIAAYEMPVYLCDLPAPTPAISYSILEKGAAGAVIITASHNPSRYNGLKFKPEYASSASREITDAIERHLRHIQRERPVPEAQRRVKAPPPLPLDEAQRHGLVYIFDPRPAYLKKLRSLVDLERLRSTALNVIADPMFGSGIGYFPALLNGGSIAVTEIHGERNPLFPGIHNPEPLPDNLWALSQAVVAQGADVGLANDGDADRMGVVDERGSYLNPLVVYALLLFYLLEIRGWRGPVVRTAGGTIMADKLAARYGVPVYQTSVGFKHVAAKMMEVDALFGGEESGGYAFRGHIPERDGILAGLYFLDLMAVTGKSPSRLVEALYDLVGFHDYDRVDLPCPPLKCRKTLARLDAEPPQQIAGLRVLTTHFLEGFKFYLEDDSWLMLRFSGTEPLLRIYAESVQPGKATELLVEGKKLAGL